MESSCGWSAVLLGFLWAGGLCTPWSGSGPSLQSSPAFRRGEGPVEWSGAPWAECGAGG